MSAAKFIESLDWLAFMFWVLMLVAWPWNKDTNTISAVAIFISILSFVLALIQLFAA